MGLRTDFVEHKKRDASCLPAFPFPLPVGYGTQPYCIKHDEDDVGLIDDFVEHAVVASTLLFIHLVGSCRVQTAGQAEMSLADADSTSWASEESVGLEAIILSSFRGA